ncbi:MAG TPA: YidC/Oxa1 family membrane protein insertase [Acidimicrobiales bacterium]|nr:YidC/Oxa1 family membrane protein insertase [Acidimicrobiales bacterium]
MIHAVLLGSTVGQVFQPLYEALAWIMAFFYAAVPNFAVAIALLTVAVMVVTAPLTVKSTRSTIAMQRVAPELKKIQAKYKGDRTTLNEEMMKLYKEHNINPAGGCLPMLIQLPVFVVLYGVIRGLTNTVKSHGKIISEPRYISHHTKLYANLVASNGHMKAFGLDMAGTLFSHHASWVDAIPYGAIVLVAIGLQYFQMRQLNSRNPAAAQANPQMQMMQRYMPIIFAIIYLRISAGVNVYFVVSSLCRIGIQEAIFRSGILDRKPSGRTGVLPGRDGGGPRRSLMERMADAQKRALEQQQARQVAGGTAARPKALGPGTTRAGRSTGGSGDKTRKDGPGGATEGDAGGVTAGEGAAAPGGNGAKPSTGGGSGPGGGKTGQAGSGRRTGKPPGDTDRGTSSTQRGNGSNGAPRRPAAGGSKPGTNGTAAQNGVGDPKGPAQNRSARKRPRKAR